MTEDEVTVTPQMIEAGKRELLPRLKRPDESDYLLVNDDFAAMYRAMRVLEPR
jgi:hypothetical protein